MSGSLNSREWQRVDGTLVDIIREHQKDYPVKVGKLANALGLRVLLKPLPAKISGEIRPSRDTPAGFEIGINRFEKDTRQRFTIAHEIGHYLLHSHLIGGGIVDNVLYRSRLSSKIEAEANRVAADILMPKHLIRKVAEEQKLSFGEENSEIFADALKVSKQAMGIRLGH